jgi:hypothetical protein
VEVGISLVYQALDPIVVALHDAAHPAATNCRGGVQHDADVDRYHSLFPVCREESPVGVANGPGRTVGVRQAWAQGKDVANTGIPAGRNGCSPPGSRQIRRVGSLSVRGNVNPGVV